MPSELGTRKNIDRLPTQANWHVYDADQANIHATRSVDICEFPLSLREQYRIVAEVERRFSLIREVKTQVDANLTCTEQLRHSILVKVFSGQLGFNDTGINKFNPDDYIEIKYGN